jgi:hypothetical protein
MPDVRKVLVWVAVSVPQFEPGLLFVVINRKILDRSIIKSCQYFGASGLIIVELSGRSDPSDLFDVGGHNLQLFSLAAMAS